jgi:hypothetical protein
MERSGHISVKVAHFMAWGCLISMDSTWIPFHSFASPLHDTLESGTLGTLSRDEHRCALVHLEFWAGPRGVHILDDVGSFGSEICDSDFPTTTSYFVEEEVLPFRLWLGCWLTALTCCPTKEQSHENQEPLPSHGNSVVRATRGEGGLPFPKSGSTADRYTAVLLSVQLRGKMSSEHRRFQNACTA